MLLTAIKGKQDLNMSIGDFVMFLKDLRNLPNDVSKTLLEKEPAQWIV